MLRLHGDDYRVHTRQFFMLQELKRTRSIYFNSWPSQKLKVRQTSRSMTRKLSSPADLKESEGRNCHHGWMNSLKFSSLLICFSFSFQPELIRKTLQLVIYSYMKLFIHRQNCKEIDFSASPIIVPWAFNSFVVEFVSCWNVKRVKIPTRRFC